MSFSIDSAQSKWLAQIQGMREAIAELQLARTNDKMKEYGHDIVVEDDDLTGDSGTDSVWDIASEEGEDEYSSGYSDGIELSPPDLGINESSYDQVWLQSRCTAFASRSSGLDATELKEHILALLASDSKGMSVFSETVVG